MVLGIWGVGPSVEHEIGRHVHQVGTNPVDNLSEVAYRLGVGPPGPVGVAFAAVHVGPRRTVHDDLRTVGPNHLVNGVAVGHV